MDATPPAAAGSTSRPSPSSGIPLALRRLAIGLAGLAVAVLAGAACALSFDDLRALAIAGRAEPGLAYLYPAGFDALLVVALISVPLLRGARLLVRLQAGLVLLLLLTAAATAAVTTASGVAFDVRRAAIVVALLPWVMLVIAFWLLLVLVKHAQARRADLDGVSDAGEIVPFDGDDSDDSDDDRPQSGPPVATSRSSTDTPIASARPSASTPVATSRSNAGTHIPTSRPSSGTPIASARPSTADAPDTASRFGTAAGPAASYRSSTDDGPGVPTDPYPVLKEAAEPVRHAPSPTLAPEATEAPETPPVTELPAGAESASEAVAPTEPEHPTDSATETETVPRPVTDAPATIGSKPQPVAESPAPTGSKPQPVAEQAPPGRKRPQRPIRWGDLVRPYAGDVLVHPRPKKTPTGTTPPAEIGSEHKATPAEPATERSTAPTEPAHEHGAMTAEAADEHGGSPTKPAAERSSTSAEPSAEHGGSATEPAVEVVVEDIADEDMWNDEDTVSVVDVTATEFAEPLESAELARPLDLDPPQPSDTEPAQPSKAAGSEPAEPAEVLEPERSEPAEHRRTEPDAERSHAEPDAERSEPAEDDAEALGLRGTVSLVAASDEASAELSRRYGEAAEEIAERFARPRRDESGVDTRPLRQLRDAPDPAHASEAADPEEQPTTGLEPRSAEPEGGSVPLAPPSGRMRSTPRPPS